MADPILTVDGVYGPGEMQTPEQLPAYIPATPMPQIDFDSYRNGLSGGGRQEDYESSIRRKIAAVPVNREQNMAFTPIPFNSKESGFDSIYNSFKDSLYRTEGFIPYRDNEDLYARELGKSGQLWQGLKGILPLAGIAHNEAWKSEADMWSGLLTGDFKKAFSLTMDSEDLLKLNQLTTDINNSNFVPLTAEQREGTFNMGKFSRGLQQFGFTLGVTAQFLEQTALEMAATALTAPETVGGSILAEIGNITRRAVKAAKTLDKFYDVNKAFAKVMKFENTFLDANKISKMYNGLNDIRKASPIGSFGNFYRFTKEYNFAASEARFERAQSYAEFIEEKEREFFQENGRIMNDEERSVVEQQAMEISNANGVTNIALLYAMNRLNMGNVLRTGFGLSKAIAAETGTIADDIIMRSAKPGNMFSKYFKKKAAKEAETAAAGPFMKASDVKMFSSEWFRGKGNSGFRWFADSAWEGVQEVSQSVSAKYWKDYYSEKAMLSEEARNDWGHLMGLSQRALGKALGAQKSQEGLDTFISGFIIGIPSVAMNKAIGYGQRKMFSKEYEAKQKRIQESVDALNKFAASPMQVFNRNLEGYVNQTEIAEGMKRAAKEKNPYAFKNLERKAFQEFVMTAHKAGKLDAMLDMLGQATTDLTDEQFKETFGIESDSINRKTAADYVNNLKSKAQQFVKNYDDVARRMPNPVNYNQYKKGTLERVEAELKHVAWNKTLEDYVFQRDTHQDIVSRYKDILAKNQDNLGSQAYEAFYKMTNVEFVDQEIGILRDQIRVMNSAETLTKDQRELMKEYTKKLELLTKWKAEMGTLVKPGEMSAPATPSKTFTDFLNLYQRAAGMPELEADKVRDAFNDLSDLFRLDQDQRATIKNLNFLADPDNFSKLFNMHNELLSDEYKNIMKHRQEKSDNYDKILPMIMQDADFRSKHYLLIEQLEQALAEGNNNLFYDILDKIYEAEFGEPVVGKEEAEAASDTQNSPQGNTSELDRKKADIERRRKQELDRIANKYFPNSKFTDILYHGTRGQERFEQFDENKIGELDSGYFGKGIYLTPNKSVAEGYAKPYNGIVLYSVVNLENPLRTDANQANTGITLDNYDGAIVTLGEDMLGLSERPVDPNEVVEVVLKKSEQIQILSEEESRKVDEINAKYDTELAALEASSGNQAPKPPAPVTENKLVESLKAEIAKAASNQELAEVLKNVSKAADEKKINEDQYDELLDLITARKNEVAKSRKSTFIDDKSAEFVKDYNNLLDNLEQVLAKPDVTEDQVRAAFRTMNPILLKLEPKVRMKYQKPLEEKRQDILQLIQKRDAAKDIKGLMKFITDTLSNMNQSISEAVDQVFQVLDLVVDPGLKDTVITHFEQEYERSINARVAAMSRKASGAAAGSSVAAAMIDQRNKFLLEVESSLERLKRQSEDLASKKGNLVFTVEVSKGYSTSLNSAIQSYTYNSNSTDGQNAAINNLLLAGVLGQDDLNAFDRNGIKGASELVNRGVSRIFALQINKAAEAFTKDKTKVTDLKNVLKDYFVSRTDDFAKQDKLKKFVDDTFVEDIKSTDSVEDILEIFNINKTQEISDDQYKLLSTYRKAVTGVIEDTNILSSLNKIENRKQQQISANIKSFAEFLDADTVNLFKPFLKDKDTAAFKNELFSMFDKVNKAKTYAEASTAMYDMAQRYMKKRKEDNGSEMINALYVAATEMMNNVDAEVGGIELTEAEMVDLVNGKSVRVLNNAQIDQLKEFSKVYLEQLKNKLKAASGFVPGPLALGQGKLTEPIQMGTLKFISLRPKMSSDIRTADELAAQLKVSEGKVVIKDALEFVSKSKFATDTEKYLADSMAVLFPAGATIIIDNELDSVGEYDSETGEIRINLQATGFSEELPSSALETVILHELIHAKIEDAISDPNSEYGRAIRSVFNAVKDSDNAQYFYAFSKELQLDEQLREFVTEAFTNPAFQYMLAKTPYANSKKTTWQVFLEVIKKILAKLGVNTEENALNEVLNLTSEILNASAGQMLERIGQAGTVADLSSLRNEIRKLRQKFKIDDEEYNTLSSAISANSRQFRVKELNEKLKNSIKVNVDGKTYHYLVDQSGMAKFEVYTIGPKGPRRVRSANRLEPVIRALAKKAGFAAIIEPSTAGYIKDLMGDPKVSGTYASGEMRGEDEEGFIQYPEMYMKDDEDFTSTPEYRTPSLKFSNADEFSRFERKYAKALVERRKSKTRFSQILQELENEFGAIAVKGYGELYSSIGSIASIRKLINKRVISVDSKSADGLMELIYETDNVVLDFLRWVDSGGLFNKTQEQAVREKISNALNYYFGFQVSSVLQNEIENELADEVDTPPPPPGPDPVLVITTTKSEEEYKEDLTRLDYTNASHPVFDRSAKNPYPLRSTANDIFYDKQTGVPMESNAYRDHYSNVREVINNLHLKPESYFADLYVTLDKNNHNLRWDGSVGSEFYFAADNPVIGYISDRNGNPVVFDRKGNRVGQIDKSNLDDHKDLDNGDNQIVYFHLPKKENKDRFDEALFEKFEKSFDAALSGQPQIARISRITPGVMNFMDVAIPTTKTTKNTAKNPELREQLMRDNVVFSLNRITGELNAIVTAPDGSKNTRGLFPSDTRRVNVTVDNGVEVPLSAHVFEVMRTYLEMKLQGRNPSELGNIENSLIPFVYNIWLTGSNHKLKIPQNFSNITIKVPDMDATNEVRKTNPNAAIIYKNETYKVFETDYSTNQVNINTQNLKKVLNYVNSMPVNIWSQWLEGTKPFRFPVIVQENGEKSIKFVEKDYLKFLMDEVGLKTYFLEIPEGSELKRYNSIVEFTIPTALTPTTASTVSQQDIINDSDAVQKKVDNNIASATGKNVIKDPKRKKYRAPKLQNIYEKTCK